MNDLIAQPAGVLQVASERRLTAAEFQGLAEVPAAAEWFANLDNPRTRRAYQGDIGVWGAMEPKTNVSSESHRKGAFRSPAHPPGITL
ncbi:hypothetical protein [Stutzerimonas chloritidismutans]